MHSSKTGKGLKLPFKIHKSVEAFPPKGCTFYIDVLGMIIGVEIVTLVFFRSQDKITFLRTFSEKFGGNGIF